jgi:Cys-tRNA(Pro)/Cys-tRNA(Cys) deacylase
MPPKLNSMRLLDQRKVPYQVLEYPDNIRDAERVAQAVDLPPEMVYKTLVVQAATTPAPKRPYLAIIPADCQLNLKKMARAAGVKKVKMTSFADAERLTGLKVGGISALALVQKQWPVYLDARAEVLNDIVISAGQRGLQIRFPVAALIEIVNAQLVDVADRNH